MAIISDPHWRQSVAGKWKEMISKNRPNLCKAIDTAEFIDHLESLKVFNSRTCQTFRSTNGKYNQVSAILTALLKRPLEDFLKFCDALENSGQKHIIETFFTSNREIPEPPSSPLPIPLQPVTLTHTDARPEEVVVVDNDPLRGAWKDLIRNSYPALVDGIDPDNGLMAQLISKKIISEWMQDTFTTKEGCSRRAASILDHLLLKRPYEDFLQFRESLIATNQGHIVQKYLTLDRSNRQLNQSDCRGPKVPTVDFQRTRSEVIDDELLTRLQELDWRAVFVEARSVLVDRVETSDGFINYLFALGVFNSMSYEACEEKDTTYKQMEFVLDYMRRRPDEDFIKLCTALAKTNQMHIVNTLLEYKVENRPMSISRASSIVEENAEGDRARNHGIIAQPLGGDQAGNHGFIAQPTEGDRAGNYGVIAQPAGGDRAGNHQMIAHPGEGDQAGNHRVIAQPAEGEQAGNHGVIGQPAEGDRAGNHGVIVHPAGGDQAGNHQVIAHPTEEVMPPTEVVKPGNLEVSDVENGMEIQPSHEALGQNTDVAGTFPNPVPPSQIHHGVPALHENYDDAGPADIGVVNVKPCNEYFYQMYHNDSYKIAGQYRGLCVIINNEQVQGLDARHGTQKDGQLLSDLFKGLRFTVKQFYNITAMGIQQELEKIAEGNDLRDHSCFVLFVLSHGQSLHDQSGRRTDCIYGSDGKAISVSDILLPLTDAKCPNLKGKPRLIFFQACRGEHRQTQTDSAPSRTEPDARGEQTQSDIPHAPSPPVYRDFLIGYPTQREYVSFRNTELGSWYVNALVQVFMQKAWNTSLSEMLNMVSGKINKWSTDGDVQMKQSSNYESHLTKSFYFFPGIVR